ncbi:hypothetical protein LZ198_33470 [Myxococcus sp. K15C18031901]|uniref:hypothetical protein n=1 Tax=Myxococcus dinghuensis TaxID=2906761 RepID=UPI0020A78AEF|nr:hypothetical protein [Myxococcus dinghuensis]MCP3103806.1 hypothetical protein [Myxococcus dinghuensis]
MGKSLLAVAVIAGGLMGCGGPEALDTSSDLGVDEHAQTAREACLEACAVQSSRCWQNATTPEQQLRCERLEQSCPQKCE